MEDKDKKELIISTIEGEKHLGENLKKILIEYIYQLEDYKYRYINMVHKEVK